MAEAPAAKVSPQSPSPAMASNLVSSSLMDKMVAHESWMAAARASASSSVTVTFGVLNLFSFFFCCRSFWFVDFLGVSSFVDVFLSTFVVSVASFGGTGKTSVCSCNLLAVFVVVVVVALVTDVVVDKLINLGQAFTSHGSSNNAPSFSSSNTLTVKLAPLMFKLVMKLPHIACVILHALPPLFSKDCLARLASKPSSRLLVPPKPFTTKHNSIGFTNPMLIFVSASKPSM
mmetsp:Transcript_3374/g.11438  ORF Transcript_3374/g.11438 Transcript_3374/m.11438 type:complete len:231 (-) Transcript_3374:929-1621(-)